MRKGPNPRVFLALAVASMALGGGLSFMSFNRLSAAKEDLRKLQSESKDANTLAKDVTASEATLKECEAKLTHLEQGVQTYAYVPTMLTELEKLGKVSGLSVVGVRPAPRQATKKETAEGVEKPKRKVYDELDIEVKARGSYRAVMTFVNALERFPKIVAARTVELSPKNVAGSMAFDLDVTISLRAYVFSTPGSEPTKTAMTEGNTHEG